MSDTTIYRQFVVSYDVQESCSLTNDDYQQIVNELVKDGKEATPENIADMAETLGYDWEVDYHEPKDEDEITDIWEEKND